VKGAWSVAGGGKVLSLEVTLAQNSEVSATSPAMTNHLQMSVKSE